MTDGSVEKGDSAKLLQDHCFINGDVREMKNARAAVVEASGWATLELRSGPVDGDFEGNFKERSTAARGTTEGLDGPQAWETAFFSWPSSCAWRPGLQIKRVRV